MQLHRCGKGDHCASALRFLHKHASSALQDADGSGVSLQPVPLRDRYVIPVASTDCVLSGSDSPYNWDHLFRALRRYLELFRVTPSFGSSMSGFPTAPTHDAIQQSELAGILSWLRLAESVVTHVGFCSKTPPNARI